VPGKLTGKARSPLASVLPMMEYLYSAACLTTSIPAGANREATDITTAPVSRVMRILFLNPTGQIGGAETSLLALVAGLRKLNPSWEFNLITGEEGPVLAKAVALGAKVEVLPFPPSLAGTGDSGLS